MKKNNLFYDKYANIKRKLFIFSLVISFVLLGAGIGVLKVNNSENIVLELESVSENYEISLNHLINIVHIYAIDIRYISNEILNNKMSWDYGTDKLDILLNNKNLSWFKYKDTLSFADSQKINLIQSLFNRIDNTLKEYYINRDNDALLLYINDEYNHNIYSIIDIINTLIKNNFSNLRKIYQNHKINNSLCHNIGVVCIIISSILFIIILLQWNKCKSLIDYL